MKTQFYIDRSVGHAIWLDVEDGIFTGCPHEGKMEEKITEKYKGLPISEVKEKYEKAFEGVYTCVHSSDYTGLLDEHFAWDTKMKVKWGVIHTNPSMSKEQVQEIKDAIEEDRKQQYQVELKIRDKWIELKEVHGFVFYPKKYHDLVGVVK